MGIMTPPPDNLEEIKFQFRHFGLLEGQEIVRSIFEENGLSVTEPLSEEDEARMTRVLAGELSARKTDCPCFQCTS